MNNASRYNFLDTVQDGIWISRNLDLTVCYKFQGISIHHQDDSGYQTTYQQIVDALNSVDEGLVFNFIKRNRPEYRGVLEKHLDLMKEESGFDQKRKEILREKFKSARAIEQFLFITSKYNPKNRFKFERLLPFGRLGSYSKVHHEMRIEDLRKKTKQIIETLSHSGLQFCGMSEDEVANYCYYHLNIKQEPVHLEFPVYITNKNNDYLLAQKTVRDQVMDENTVIEVFSNHIKISDHYISVCSIDLLGANADSKFLDKLSAVLPQDHDYLVSFEKIENEKVFKLISDNRKNLTLRGEIDSSVKGNSVEIELSAKSRHSIYEDGEQYKIDVQKYNLQSFKICIMFTVRAKSSEELETRVRDIKKRLRQSEFHNTWLTTNGRFTLLNYHAFLPGNIQYCFDWNINDTASLAYYLPVSEDFKGYDTFNDTAPSNQIYFNCKNEIAKYHSYYFDSNFKHHEVTATTGSGKTFDLNKQIDGILSEKNENTRNPIVMAIEPKRGFLKICRFYNGEVISFDFSSEKSYNPFFKKRDLYTKADINYEGISISSAKYDVLILDYYLNLLELLAKEEEKTSLAPRIRMVLLQIIVELYDGNDDDFLPILSDITNKLSCFKSDDDQIIQDIRRVRQNLEYFCLPQYKNLLNIREELDIKNDFLYYDLSRLEENQNMKETVYYILSAQIMKMLREPGRIKYLFIDEASVFYKTEIGARMIDYFVRLSRSLGGVIILASQNVSDSLNSKSAETIKNALAVQSVLWLKSGHEHLTSLGYTLEEKKSIENLQKSPGYFIELFRKIGEKPMILKSESDPYLYWLNTNDPDDDILFLDHQSKFPDLNFAQLIEKLGDRYPHGHYTK